MSDDDIRELLAKIDYLERTVAAENHTEGFRLGVNFMADVLRNDLKNLLFQETVSGP